MPDLQSHSIKTSDDENQKSSLLDRLDCWLSNDSPFACFWRWRVKHCYYNIRDYFFPRQKWLMGYTTKSWMDKTELIPAINFGMVIHFVEEEDALNVTNWEGSFPEGKIFKNQLIECYNWAKTGRAAMEKELSESYPKEKDDEIFKESEDGKFFIMKSCEERFGMSYEEAYKEVNRLEKLLDETDTKWLNWIVQNRGHLWT